jgi:hypothetical protein
VRNAHIVIEGCHFLLHLIDARSLFGCEKLERGRFVFLKGLVSCFLGDLTQDFDRFLVLDTTVFDLLFDLALDARDVGSELLNAIGPRNVVFFCGPLVNILEHGGRY